MNRHFLRVLLLVFSLIGHLNYASNNAQVQKTFVGPCVVKFGGNSVYSPLAITTYYSTIDGIYELPIWSKVSHIGALCVCTPGCNVPANSIIRISHNITSACTSLDLGSNVTFIVEAGGSFTLTGNGAITGTGGIQVDAGGLMTVTGDITLNGAGSATINGTLNVFGTLTDLNGGGSVCGGAGAIINVTTPPPAGTICATFGGTLPIELTYFKGKSVSSKTNFLEWQTAQEISNKYFVIERSLDGVNFETITTINGAGNSNSIKNYSHEDLHLSTKLNYYRLKQIDENGYSTTSGIIKVETVSNEFDVKVYPIPSAGDVYIHVPEDLKEVDLINIKVYDLFGKLVFESKLEYTKQVMEINFELAIGYYNISVEAGNDRYSKSLTVH